VDVESTPIPKITPRNEKVAIIGAGPAGLTAAYFLALEGFPVTIFEALPVGGGMLRVGIPDYRLPPSVLEKEIRSITRLGVDIRYNTAMGRDITIDTLMADGFESVYLAVGAHASMKLNIPGEDTDGVITGVRFLRETALYKRKTVNGHVVIVGGGDVAIDAARSAVRMGADKVSIIYRRTRTEMPASDEEIEDALEEGVQIDFLMAPVEVVAENSKVTGLKCLRMELGQPDESGRRRPVPPVKLHARVFLPVVMHNPAPGSPSALWLQVARPLNPFEGISMEKISRPAAIQLRSRKKILTLFLKISSSCPENTWTASPCRTGYPDLLKWKKDSPKNRLAGKPLNALTAWSAANVMNV